MGLTKYLTGKLWGISCFSKIASYMMSIFKFPFRIKNSLNQQVAIGKAYLVKRDVRCYKIEEEVDQKRVIYSSEHNPESDAVLLK